MDAKNRHEWETCFVASDVDLPAGYYFGVSAATGDLADNHDIISLQVFGCNCGKLCFAVLLAYLHSFYPSCRSREQ